jgi:CO dehydrogenase maturation factor
MTTTIVVAGKGGVGKTAISALLIDILSKKGIVLAIDADPSTNLSDSLGMEITGTVGKAREELTDDIQKGVLSPTVTKQDVLEMKIRESLVEGARVDLLPMGRPEGPGCYCAANHMLRLSMERLAKNYDYLVVDSEAGMEHISRQTTQDVDILLIVSDPTMRGITAASRMKDLIKDMRTRVGKIYLAVNRVSNSLPPEIKQAIEKYSLNLIGTLSEDPKLTELDVKGKPINEMPQGSPLRAGVEDLVKKFGL